jgi:hypothetical protein
VKWSSVQITHDTVRLHFPFAPSAGTISVFAVSTGCSCTEPVLCAAPPLSLRGLRPRPRSEPAPHADAPGSMRSPSPCSAAAPRPRGTPRPRRSPAGCATGAPRPSCPRRRKWPRHQGVPVGCWREEVLRDYSVDEAAAATGRCRNLRQRTSWGGRRRTRSMLGSSMRQRGPYA